MSAKKIYISVVIILVLLFVMYVLPSDGVETQASIEEANDICLERTGRLPEKEFTSDGCSMWPDAKIQECCVAHDIEYWCGGEPGFRSEVDALLGECAKERYSYFPSSLVVLGVSLGGSRYLPFPWRWGYGDPYF